MSKAQFNPATDISSQAGRVVFITGGTLYTTLTLVKYFLLILAIGTSGLGANSVSLLAVHSPAHIYFTGRNSTRAAELIAKVKQASPSTEVTFLECDLSSFASVQAAAKQFLASSDRLDVLMCNAGIMATPDALSKDGYEIQFATNHMGHSLLTKLLLPVMLSTASQSGSDVRIVNVASVAYKNAPKAGIDFTKLKNKEASYGGLFTPKKWACYGQSKLANLLYTTELAKHYPSITSVAVHPGFIKTDLHQHESFMDRQIVNLVSGGVWLDVTKGAYTQVWAATAKKEELENGAFYEPIGIKTVPSTKQGRDKALAKELWEWTEKELQAWE
jgi:NAD(P)-dependent dehydrogenase (short-subunit alcohol dehydrogenase family)